MRKMTLAILLALMIPLAGCSGSSGDGQPLLPAPDYSVDQGLDDTYETDLSEMTGIVTTWQDRGVYLAELFESSGWVELDDGVYVQLTEMYRNDCPPSLCQDDLSDANTLGIGPNALITDFSDGDTVRNQGERGTCVAFALTGAVEVLGNRALGNEMDYSEQNNYFMAKKLTRTWSEAGLVPEAAIGLMVEKEIPFVQEIQWPYNPDQEDCRDYQLAYPDNYCSETEAQGGGTDDRQQDPHAASADGPVIVQADELYASVNRVRQALYRGYPVVLGINANSDFTLADKKNGVVSWVFKKAGCSSGICGHAVLAMGYQDDEAVQGGGYVIVKNSWGDNWGDGGYAYLTYEWLVNSILDAQAIVDVQYPAGQP